MLRFKLRTLLIVLTLGPPVLWFGWTKYEAWRAEWERQQAQNRIPAPAATSGTTNFRPQRSASADKGPPGFGPRITIEPRRRR